MEQKCLGRQCPETTPVAMGLVESSQRLMEARWELTSRLSP